MVGQEAQRKAWNEAMKSTAGVAALPPALQAKMTSRRSDRRKQARREKARKVTVLGDAEYRSAVWMDALEEVDPSGPVEEEEEYDELEELESSTSKHKRRKARAKAGALAKRFKPRSFASILVEEAGRPDGAARAFLNSEAVLPEKERLPPRKFCPVTGQLGIYTDPKSGIPYANLKALEQIRERAPPWMTLTGTAAYYEAVKSIRDEE